MVGIQSTAALMFSLYNSERLEAKNSLFIFRIVVFYIFLYQRIRKAISHNFSWITNDHCIRWNISFVTTTLAPTTAPYLTLPPTKINVLVPIQTSLPIVIPPLAIVSLCLKSLIIKTSTGKVVKFVILCLSVKKCVPRVINTKSSINKRSIDLKTVTEILP